MQATRTRYWVLLALCLFAFFAYLHRGALAVPAKQIQADLGVDEETLAWAMGAFFWGYAVFQIPGGLASDRWGSRAAIFAFMSLASIAMGLLGLVELVWLFFLLRGLMGLAQAGLFPASVQSIAHWFPPVERALPNGLLGAAMLAGSLAGSLLAGWLLPVLSWREQFVLFALPGVVGAVAFFVWFRNQPREHPWVNDAELRWIESAATPTGSGSTPVGPAWWVWWLGLTLVCGQQFFRAGGNLFYMTWFPRFLMESRAVSESAVGTWNAWPLAGMMVGSALGGVVMDWLLRTTGSLRVSRHYFAMVCLAAVVACFVLAWRLPDHPGATIGLLTASSFGAGVCGPAAYTVTIELAGRRVATVFSVMNMAGNFGAALAPVLVIRCKAAWDWNATLLLMAGLYAGAYLCWVGLTVLTSPVLGSRRRGD